MINRQIHAQTYFENIQSVANLRIYYEGKESTEVLYIIVLTSQKSDFEANENIPTARYGNSPKDWMIYSEERIVKVLEDFRQKSTISLSVYFLDKSIIATEPNLEDELEPVTKNFVLIADAFSLSFDENKNIAKLFNTKDQNKIWGCLLPICENLSEKYRIFARKQIEQTFRRLKKGWEDEFYKSYSHVELDIPNKTHFFRRLANIAYAKGISPKETMTTFEAKSDKFKNPPINDFRI